LLETKNDSYIIAKHNNKITFGRCNSDIIYEFKDLDHLWSSDVGGFKLRDNWNTIEDILLDLTFSIIEDESR